MTNFLQNNNKKLIKGFFGYANVFNNIDVDNDVVLQGAFDFGNDPPLPLLWQHDYKPENSPKHYIKISQLLKSAICSSWESSFLFNILETRR